MRMATTNIKEEARRLIEKMPDDSTWNDLMREIYVRQAIESGLADSQAGRTTEVETVRAEFGPKFSGRELADLLRSLPKPDEEYLALVESLAAKQSTVAESRWPR